MLYPHVAFFAPVKIMLGVSILWVFFPFKARFTFRNLPKVSWGSRFGQKAVLFRLKEVPLLYLNEELIRLILRLEKDAWIFKCHLQILFHQYDSTQYLYGQPYSDIFRLMGTLEFQFLLKAETRKILIVAHPFPREKFAMLGTNVWI